MTRKDFKIIAQAIKDTPMPMYTRFILACSVGRALKETNTLFNAHKFIEACDAVECSPAGNSR